MLAVHVQTKLAEDPLETHLWPANKGHISVEAEPLELVAHPPLLLHLLRFKLVAQSMGPPLLPPKPSTESAVRRLLSEVKPCSERARKQIRAMLPAKASLSARLKAVSMFIFHDVADTATPVVKLHATDLTVDSRVTPVADPLPDGFATGSAFPETGAPLPTAPFAPHAVPRAAGKLPLRSSELPGRLDHEVYKMLDVGMSTASIWVVTASDPRRRDREAVADEYKVVDHGPLYVKYTQLWEAQVAVDGTDLRYVLPMRRVEVQIARLAAAVTPLQLRVLYHVYLQLGIRFLKMMPEATKHGIGKMLSPWLPWGVPEPPADPLCWRQGTEVNVRIDVLSLAVRGERAEGEGLPPNLAHVTLHELVVARITNEIDEAQLGVQISAVHAFVNDCVGEAGQANSADARRDCAAWAFSLSTQEGDLSAPALVVEQGAHRSLTHDHYEKVLTVKIRPAVHVEIPCGQKTRNWFERVLHSWRKVEIFEDLTALPVLHEFDALNTIQLELPRLSLNVHLDAASVAQTRTAPSKGCVYLGIDKLVYIRAWDPPATTAVRQTVRIRGLAFWDLSAPTVEAKAAFHRCRPRDAEGMCVLRFSGDAADPSAAGDAISVDMLKRVECRETALLPYGTSYYYHPLRADGDLRSYQVFRRAYQSPAPAIITSKEFVVAVGRTDAVVTNAFLDAVLYFFDPLESLVGPSPLLGPPPNDRLIPTALDLKMHGLSVVLPAAEHIHDGVDALRATVSLLAGQGSIATLELQLGVIDVALEMVQIQMAQGCFCGLEPAAGHCVLPAMSIELAIVVPARPEDAARRTIVAVVPEFVVSVEAIHAALFWNLLIDILLYTPFLLSRCHLSATLPILGLSKWDVDIAIASFDVVLSVHELQSRRTEVTTTIEGLRFRRYKLTDTVNIKSIEASVEAFDFARMEVAPGFPCPLAKVYSLDDGGHALLVTIAKDARLGLESAPRMTVEIDMLDVTVGPALIAEVFDAYATLDPFLIVEREFNKIRARAPRPRAGAVLRAKTKRMEAYKHKVYRVEAVNVTFPGLAVR
jgi:hypothetical protein